VRQGEQGIKDGVDWWPVTGTLPLEVDQKNFTAELYRLKVGNHTIFRNFLLYSAHLHFTM